jgi:hypothetical protein
MILILTQQERLACAGVSNLCTMIVHTQCASQKMHIVPACALPVHCLCTMIVRKMDTSSCACKPFLLCDEFVASYLHKCRTVLLAKRTVIELQQLRSSVQLLSWTSYTQAIATSRTRPHKLKRKAEYQLQAID